MKLWGVLGSGPRPVRDAPVVAVEKSDPAPADRRFGMLEMLSLTTGARTSLRSFVPPHHFGWLFSIRQLQPAMKAMSDDALAAGWSRIRERVQRGTPIRDLIPEAFALIREVSARTMSEEPYEVQLLTAMGILDDRVVEMKTGEGKSLAIAMASSLAALEGKGVHVIAESTESAERDAMRYQKLYRALGLDVDVLRDTPQYDSATIQKEKRAAYAADVTYGFCDNFIFDRLQDGNWTEARMRVQRPPAYAIVDEADNVLLDIARQPVILTTIGDAPDPIWEAQLSLADRVVQNLEPGRHFEVRHENERRLVNLTDEGFDAIEAALKKAGHALPEKGLAHPTQLGFVHALQQVLLARHALMGGKHFVGDGVLVNQHNGRAQPLSRFFHGASDAVALTQGRPLEAQTVVVGQSSYQDFFASYPHLSGVTGTLEGTHSELLKVYGLPSIEIPTRLPSRLEILPDEIFVNEYLDRGASVAKVLEAHHRDDRTVLFPAVTVAQSKMLSERLRDPLLALADVASSSIGLLLAAAERLEGGPQLAEKFVSADLELERDRAREEIAALLRADPNGRERFVEFLEEHDFPARPLLGPPANPALVNAENGEHLAVYVARAGKRKALTVTTLMGRATDVQPQPDVRDRGLLVVCYGHRSSRRDDLQVAGRAGRQGQPGTVQFFSSLNDDTLSGLPAKLLRSLRDQLTDFDRLRPTDKQRFRVMHAIRRAQDRIGAEAESGRIRRAKLDRVVATKRASLEEDRLEILERDDLPEVMVSWLEAECGRALLRHRMEDEAACLTVGQLEALAKHKLNECWVLPAKEVARVLQEAGLPPISHEGTDTLPLETLFEHAGIDPSSRKNLAKSPEGLGLCRAIARWKIRYDANGMNHREIERRMAKEARRPVEGHELKTVFRSLDLPTPQVYDDDCFRFSDVAGLVDQAVAPLLPRAAAGVVEDQPALTLNQRVRDLLLENLNRIFCEFLEREASHQENLAGLVAFADLDPTVEYWKRASHEFDRMQAMAQQTTAKAFVAELRRLAPLAKTERLEEIPAELDPHAKSELEFFFASLDALTKNVDPYQFRTSAAEEMARALIDDLPPAPVRLFGSILHPVLDRVRDYQVGILGSELLHDALLELRLKLLETIQDWPEQPRQAVTAGLSRYLPPAQPSPRLENPSPEALFDRLTIEEMAPRSVRKREAGLRDDGTKRLLEEFLLGRVVSGDHPMIASAVARLAREGGEIYALGAQDRERREWLEHHAPPFFVTEDGTPYIAIDLTRDGATEALAHELRHFERWRLRRDALVAEGMKPVEAARRALEIENAPENLVEAETECVREELKIQEETARRGSSDWNRSGRPTRPEEPGYLCADGLPSDPGPAHVPVEGAPG